MDPKTQLEGPVSTKVLPFRKRALTPPYIPEKGLLQTWPGFRFENVSEEGSRALRKRTKKIYDSEEPPMIARRSEGLRMKADRKQKMFEGYSSTVPAESSEEEFIDEQDLKRAVVNSNPRKHLTTAAPPQKTIAQSGEASL